MKFTPKQTELINEYKRLEKEYGEGNVFLRYINDFWKIRFIIHISGQAEYKPIYDWCIFFRITHHIRKIEKRENYEIKIRRHFYVAIRKNLEYTHYLFYI